MRNLRDYLWPDSPAEALALLGRVPGRGALLAGGTSFAVRQPAELDFVVDVTRLALHEIMVDATEVRLGATASLQDLLEAAAVRSLAAGLVAEAVARTRTEPWRRQATVAGRLLEDDPGDLLRPACMALGARISVLLLPGPAPADLDLETGLSAAAAGPGLVLAVRIPMPPATWGFALESVTRSALDRPLAAVITGLEIVQGRVRAARVATSSLPSARRCPHVEAGLVGQVPDAATFGAAQVALLEDIAPVSDHRASAEYRTQVARVLLARALRRATAAARERS